MADENLGSINYSVDIDLAALEAAAQAQDQYTEGAREAAGAVSNFERSAESLSKDLRDLRTAITQSTQAQERQNRNNERAVQTLGRLQRSTDGLTKDYRDLRRAIDPAFRAQSDFQRGAELLNRELKSGRISMSRYAMDMAALRSNTIKATKAGGAFSGGMKGLRNQVQQAGYQFGDMAVQIAGGQSALLAITQQGSQFLGIFGAGGAVLGAVLAIGGAFAGAFVNGASAAEEAAASLMDRVEDLGAAYEDLTAAQRAALQVEFAAQEMERQRQIKETERRIKSLTSAVDSFRRGVTVRRGPNAAAELLISPEQAEQAAEDLIILQGELDTVRQESDAARQAFEDLVYGFDQAGDERATADRLDALGQLVREAESEAEAIGKTERAMALLTAERLGAQPAQIAAINAAYDAIEAEERRKGALDAARRAQRAYLQDIRRWARDQKQAAEQYGNWTQQVADSIDPLAAAEREIAKIQQAFDAGDLEGISEAQVNAYAGKMRKAATKAADEFKNPWEKAAQGVASSLQDAIVSGDWDSVGDSIGAALGASVSAVVSKALTDELSKNLTADSGVLSQIGAAFAGPIAGAVAGGIIERLTAELFAEDVDPTAQRQAEQGTGGVLGSIDEKSESIRRGIDAISATNEQLVNINAGMLAALESTLAAVSDAVTLAIRSRGSQGVTVANRGAFGLGPEARRNTATIGIATGPLGLVIDQALRELPVIGGLFGDLIDGALGLVDDITGGALSGLGDAVFGSKKVTDEGIKIIGGTVAELVRNTVAEGFVTIRKSGSLFGGSGYEKDFPTERLVTDQFTLIFQSLQASVLAGAEALGLIPAEVQTRLDEFVVDTQRVSLEGLNAEEQAAALEAVISDVFDGMVGAAVPFVDKFRDAGETLGETLTRLGAQTQLTEEAFAALGVALGTTDPQELAAYADALVNAAGGVESFSNALVTFERDFLTEAEQFENTTRRLTSAMGDLPLPETREGFAELLRAQLDAEQGNDAAVASLLRLAPLASEYYQHLEDMAEDAADSLARTAEELAASMSAATDAALASLRRSVSAQRDAAREEFDARMTANRLALDAARSGLQAIQQEVRGVEQAADRLRGSFDPARTASRDRAVSALRAALLSGDLSGAGDAAGRAVQIETGDFLSGVDYAREQGRTLALLGKLEESGEEQLTTAERSVRALERQSDILQREFDAEQERLDKILEDAQTQVDHLRGIETGVTSVASAVMALAEALGRETSNAVEQAYRQAGRTADAEGMAYWQQEIAAGRATIADLEYALWRNTPGASDWFAEQMANAPRFANGGNHYGGMRIVGDGGAGARPEAEFTGASRIVSHPDLMKAMGGSDRMAKELADLRYELVDLQKQLNTKVATIEDYTRSIRNVVRSESQGMTT